VLHDGTPVGLTTSGGFGFTVDKSPAFACVGADAAVPGTELTVLILGIERRSSVVAEPGFDPTSPECVEVAVNA
jgi:dimethylglycine dehydrogenase